MKTDAKFSDCRSYRYALWRIWDETKPYVMIIGLNPSTADEIQNPAESMESAAKARGQVLYSCIQPNPAFERDSPEAGCPSI